MKLYQKTKNAFTLIELIIVISILTILATIAFISFENYTKSARDSNKVTSLRTYEKGLQIYQTSAGIYPNPDNMLQIVGVSYQGNIMQNVMTIIHAMNGDSSISYLYSLSQNKQKYQLGVYLEEQKSIFFSGIIPNVFAQTGNNTQQYLYTIGDNIGMVFDPIHISPVQEIYHGSLDFNTNTGTFLVQFPHINQTGNTITGSGISLINQITQIQSSCMLGNTLVSNGNQITAYNESCNYIQRTCNQGTFDGDGNYKYDTCITSQNLDCAATTQSGYIIPSLAHNETQNITKSVSYGTADINATCNNGVLTYGNENIHCNTNYVLQGGTCIADSCPGNAPTYSVSNGTQSIAGTWNHNTTPGICTFVCQSGYYYQGNTCNAAQTGYYVATIWQTSQAACNTNTNYQDSTGQTNCKTVSPGYYTTPVGAVPHTSQTLCEANNYCLNGVKTPCSTGFSSIAGSTSCTINTYTVSGDFIGMPSGAVVYFCGTSFTLDTSGHFSAQKPYGTVCNNITAEKANYNCKIITDGPAFLSSDITNIFGDCELIVNGNCGTSNGQTFSTAPTSNLCSAGTASSVSGTGPWTWTCNGTQGGTNANCSANKAGLWTLTSTTYYCGIPNGYAQYKAGIACSPIGAAAIELGSPQICGGGQPSFRYLKCQ